MENILTYITWESSILLAVIGAILLYFGKIIGDVRLGKNDHTTHYMEGLFFTVAYVLMPVMFSLLLVQEGITWILPFPAVIIIQAGLAGILHRVVNVKQIRRDELEGYFAKKFRAKMKMMMKGHDLLKRSVGNHTQNAKKSLSRIEILSHKWILFIIALTLAYITIAAIGDNNALRVMFMAIFMFIDLTALALVYGFPNYYPPARLQLVNGEIMSGKITKFGQFITVLKGDKKYFVNENEVRWIEMDVLKKGADPIRKVARHKR